MFDFLNKKSEKSNNSKSTSNNGVRIEPTISFKHEAVNTPQEPEIVPVEKIIKGIKPNSVGLYPHEILTLSYAPKYFVEGNSYPGFWWYRYGVSDVDKSLKSLLDRGFLQVGSLKSAIEQRQQQ